MLIAIWSVRFGENGFGNASLLKSGVGILRAIFFYPIRDITQTWNRADSHDSTRLFCAPANRRTVKMRRWWFRSANSMRLTLIQGVFHALYHCSCPAHPLVTRYRNFIHHRWIYPHIISDRDSDDTGECHRRSFEIVVRLIDSQTMWQRNEKGGSSKWTAPFLLLGVLLVLTTSEYHAQ